MAIEEERPANRVHVSDNGEVEDQVRTLLSTDDEFSVTRVRRRRSKKHWIKQFMSRRFGLSLLAALGIVVAGRASNVVGNIDSFLNCGGGRTSVASVEKKMKAWNWKGAINEAHIALRTKSLCQPEREQLWAHITTSRIEDLLATPVERSDLNAQVMINDQYLNIMNDMRKYKVSTKLTPPQHPVARRAVQTNKPLTARNAILEAYNLGEIDPYNKEQLQFVYGTWVDLGKLLIDSNQEASVIGGYGLLVSAHDLNSRFALQKKEAEEILIAGYGENKFRWPIGSEPRFSSIATVSRYPEVVARPTRTPLSR